MNIQPIADQPATATFRRIEGRLHATAHDIRDRDELAARRPGTPPVIVGGLARLGLLCIDPLENTAR